MSGLQCLCIVICLSSIAIAIVLVAKMISLLNDVLVAIWKVLVKICLAIEKEKSE